VTWLRRRDVLKLGAAGAGALALGALGVRGGCRLAPALVIGSKDFQEQWILAELLSEVVARATGLRSERVDLGGTLLCHAALLGGDIDSYVEYTGTALTAVLDRERIADPDRAYRAVARAYEQRFDLRWLPPLGFENAFAVVVRRRDAEALGLRTLSDLRAVQERFRAAVPFEFYDRPDGYRGMIAAYDLAFARAPQQMSIGNAYRAVAAGRADLTIGNSTDGLIEHLDLTMLADDRHYFPPYHAAAVVRGDFARRHPRAIDALAALSGRITTDAMRRANYEVDNRQRHPKPVAVELLASLRA